ncbi:phage tail spike protein [Bacillus sp. JJ1566]|uniref:phage tail spike protein n=1 Tax=Bacillus sp. JJ1566 TaxID=3122961 RepID=UPI002FFED572
MTLVHILDKQTDDIIGTLNSAKAEYWDALKTDSLNKMNVFDFVANAKIAKAALLEKRNRLLLQDEDGFFSEYIITYAEQYKRGEKLVKSNASFTDLAKAKVIEPQTLQGATPQTAAALALDGTEVKLGDIDYTFIRTITIVNYTDPYSFLKQIASTFELELRFRIVVDGNKITRYADFKKTDTTYAGTEIEFGKDLIGVKRKEDSQRIVTALLGVGPEREDGTRLTVFVEDKDALQRWGRHGQHLIEAYEPESTDADMTEDRLRTLTENELEKRIDAIVSYECEAVSLEHIKGFEHKKIRKGMTVRIKDDGYQPPLYLEARIQEVEVDPITNRIKGFKIGNFIEYSKADLEKQIANLTALMRDRLAKLVLASITSSAGDVFKNGQGTTTLTAETFLGGAEVDADGKQYTYNWSKRDKDGNLVDFNSTSKSITVASSEISEKSTYNVEIAINDKTSQVAQITLSNVFDGQDGDRGPEGPRGPQGDPGKDGYTPIKGTDYFDGKDGKDGINGSSSFLWVKYSQNLNGNPMTTDPSGAAYIGVAVTTEPTEPTSYTSYNWSLFKGTDGVDGEPGDNGETSYLHIKYSNDGGKTFTANNGETLGEWIGVYVDFTQADSNNVSSYTWNKVKGEKGDKGDPGVGIVSVTEYYLATSSVSGVTTATSGWTTEIQTITSVKKYLWNYEKITYSNGQSENTLPIIIGTYGDKGDIGSPGRSIDTITEYYLATSASSGVTRGTAGWTPTIQNVTNDKKYLWNYEVIKYKDPVSTEYVEPVIIGVYGDTGERGPEGKSGVDAKLLYLSTTSDVMSFNADGTPNPASQTITFTANLQNTTGTATFVATPYNTAGAALTVISLGGSGNSRTLTQNQWPTTAVRVVVTATLSGLTDTVTITQIKSGADGGKGDTGDPGKDAIVGFLTNESITLGADVNGNVGDFSKATGTFEVYQGITKRTGTSVTYSKVSQVGCTASINTSGVYSITAMSTDTATVTFRAIYGGVTIDKIVTLAKSKTGATGGKGDPGKGVTNTSVSYQYHYDGTAAPTGTWYGTPPTPVKGQYLWTRTITTYSDASNVTTYSVSYNATDGQHGTDGKGIKSTVITYQLHTNGTTVPTGTWLANPPSPVQGRYLWTRTVISYTDGTSSTSYSTSYHATDGQKGDKGDKGDSGPQGPQGPAGKDGIAHMGTTAPTNPAVNATWFQTDSTGKVIAIRKWNGSTWETSKMDATTLGVETLSALSADLGEVTAGILRGIRITTTGPKGSIDLQNDTLKSRFDYAVNIGGGPKPAFDELRLDSAALWIARYIQGVNDGGARLVPNELLLFYGDENNMATYRESRLSMTSAGNLKISSPLEFDGAVPLFPWTTMTLINGATHYLNSTYNASYQKDAMGLVHMRGSIKMPTNNVIVFVLPAGCRPENTIYPPVVVGNGTTQFGYCKIESTGRVVINTNMAAPSFVSFDGIAPFYGF